MTTHSTSAPGFATEAALFSGDCWFDPIEDGVRAGVRSFIEAELTPELRDAGARVP